MEMIFTIANIKQAAQQLLEESKGRKVWAFYAPMGAGKTTLVHTLCNALLGVKDVVSSPTFAIISEYRSERFPVIYHMDWYRLKDEEEAINAGVEDALESGDLCLVEWPEKAEGLLPDNVFKIEIKIIDAGTRRLITGNHKSCQLF